MMASILLQLLYLWSTSWVVSALPQGFVDEAITRLSGATSGTFAKDANDDWLFFLATKEGDIVLVNDPFGVDTKTTHVLTLKPCTSGERGVQTILAHPKFAENGWLYVYYAPYQDQGCSLGSDPKVDYSGPSNQLSRFQWQNGKLTGEKVLLNGPSNAKEIHNGGAMNFGPDGYLYLALGEGGSSSPANSQFMWTLHGKMLRITEDGSTPPDNPFASKGVSCKQNGRDASLKRNCTEIFALGFRNPFRFAMDPNVNRVRFFVNDVGGEKWEEVSEGGAGMKLANYGWPSREGPCNTGSYTSGCTPDAKFTDPIHWFAHLNSTGGSTGKAIVGGAFVPNGVWPSNYDNTYLFAEFVEGKIFQMTKDTSSACRTCKPPRSAYKETLFHKWPRIVDIFFGPYSNTQALYYITRQGNINIRRIRFTGNNNRSPVAAISATSALKGRAPFTVLLNASKSKDPDPNDSLSYSWNWGDGSARSSALKVSHTYTKNGTYSVEMTVTDKAGLKDQAFVTVVVGTPPAVSMNSPSAGTTLAVGESFWLNATAKDSTGRLIPNSALVWEMRLHHDTHWHPYLEGTAGNGLRSKAAPAPEDYVAATNSYLEFLLTVTDSQGLQTKISRNVMPRKVYLDFDTKPSNLEVLLLDGTLIKTPARILSWENHLLNVNLLASQNFAFQSWSDGEGQSHFIRVPKKGQAVPRYVLTLKSGGAKKLLPVRDCSTAAPCDMCEGHCSSTPECRSGLVCYKKTSSSVPGCAGSDFSETSWCTQA
jgi:glucose/arabinose dehydrogenase